MQFKTLMAAAAAAVSLGSFAQPAFAESRSDGPITSLDRVTVMMRNIDRFQARRDRVENSQRYYVERHRARDGQYAMRTSSRDALRR